MLAMVLNRAMGKTNAQLITDLIAREEMIGPVTKWRSKRFRVATMTRIAQLQAGHWDALIKRKFSQDKSH